MGEKKYAVVTGANKGIGLEIVRMLDNEDITVVLTARDVKKGMEATLSLSNPNVLFHQLDVCDPASADSLFHFIQSKFGRLDILVNNAGVSGLKIDEDGFKSLNIHPMAWFSGMLKLSPEESNAMRGMVEQVFEECIDTNYFGCKRVTEALLPLLKLSTSGARIVNLSSCAAELKMIPDDKIRKELADINSLTEKKLDDIIEKFLHDLKQGKHEENGWPKIKLAYSISKVIMNGYTRVLARKFPEMYINCVHPGYVDTDINWHTGTMTVQEGAKGPVMLALLPDGGPSGYYFNQTELSEF